MQPSLNFIRISGSHRTHKLSDPLGIPVTGPTPAKMVSQFSGENLHFSAPQLGQTQSSGRSPNFVPGRIPLKESPSAGSYANPQLPHTYFAKASSLIFAGLMVNAKIIVRILRETRCLKEAGFPNLSGKNFS
jgi:hypothetical protein